MHQRLYTAIVHRRTEALNIGEVKICKKHQTFEETEYKFDENANG